MSVGFSDRQADGGELLANRAYVELRDRVVTLKIPPGAPINEEEIARELGIGRTPIREAIKRLALENLAVVFPRRGTFATDINITDLTYISDLRVLLEGHAAARAAERLTAAQREELDALLAELEDATEPDDPDALIELDARVHRFVYRCASNPYLEDALGRYFNLSLRIWYLAIERVPRLLSSVSEHRALLEAIRDGDAARAREVASEHVLGFERKIRSVL